MEINVKRQHVEGTEALQSFAFGFKATPKAFHLMISQLYKDTIAAFIRELSTNAYEAHQMLGIENEPFEVTLPTLLNPSFKIRDFGPGLSVEEIGKVYVMIFESTKTSSNDMGGCFGLGSKSPFAYSLDIQFGVVSYKDGMKYCYTVFKDEEGYPKMNLVHQEASNARSGVEISIPINRQDHSTVEQKAREIYKWFATTPKIMSGQRPFEKIEPNTKGTNFGHYDSNHVRRASARMGNILYPIDSSLCNLHNLGSYPIVVEFPIGALSPEPSREGLSYDKKTKREIEEAFKTIKQEFIQKIQPQVDKASDMWEAVLKAQELIQNSPVSVDELKYKGQPLKTQLGYLEEKVGTAKLLTMDKLKKGDSSYIRHERNATFLLLDKKCAYQQIIKSYAATRGDVRRIYICDMAYQNHTVDKFCEFFGIDKSRLITISSIPYTAPKRAPSSGPSTRHLTKMFTWKYSMTNAESWVDAQIDAKKESGLFVVYYNNKILIGTKEISPHKLDDLVKLIGYTGVIYGVKKDSVDKVVATGNWKPFLDYAQPLAYNKIQAACADDASDAAKIMQSFRYKRMTGHDFIEKVVVHGVDVNQPDIKRAITEYKKLQNLSQLDYRTLANIAYEFFGKKISELTTQKTLDPDRYGKLLEVVEKKFPLTTIADNCEDKHLVQELVSYVVAKGI